MDGKAFSYIFILALLLLITILLLPMVPKNLAATQHLTWPILGQLPSLYRAGIANTG